MLHTTLSQPHWDELSLSEQLANIGSEVLRALNWQKKGNAPYATLAFHRALELVDFSLHSGYTVETLRELTRTREALVDYFDGDNTFASSERTWRTYFMAFTYAAALKRERNKRVE